jgi:anti-sigma factor RsiW
MKMREMFDEYLDGALDRAGRAEVERCIAAEPAAAGLLAELKAQRAARVGVYNSYVPSPAEASAFAHRVLQACADEAHAPVGHIRPNHHWIRWTAGVAAGLIIAAGAFSAVRMSVAPQVVDKPIVTEQTVYEVAVLDPRGNPAGDSNGSELAG